jgi:HD-GYP domain-containing protein (c-di-GMP phosphodiesterase class II)
VLHISASVAKNHHERLDGTGYHRLPADSITPYSRLIIVADVFDALHSRRVYKESWDAGNVIGYLSAHDNHFDREIVNYLIEVIGEILEIYKAV